MLSDYDLLAELAAGRIVVSPLGERAVQPASIDVRLGTELLSAARRISLAGGYIHKLAPGEFLLGTTLETVHVPADLACQVVGRSTTGRMGLIVETAGFVDPGWRGEITLELHNISPDPIYLAAGMGIAQLTFTRLSSPAMRPYGTVGLGSRYLGQVGPTAPRGVL